MRSSYSRHVGQRVVVQVGEDTLGGVLHEAHRTHLVIHEAALLTRQAVPMDGEIVIPTVGVRWVQVLP